MNYEISDFDRYCMALCKEKMKEKGINETEWIADGIEYEDDSLSIYRFQHYSKQKYIFFKVIHTETEFSIGKLQEGRR